ncbi:uncharacterized protein LOC127749661 [Frankliniella occidentalis]|uniref:Uncharacterized protein LOC127749661 n=1 Tax=Frankliniella occidentalis TaxID=133901 RepID=A0A9C6TYH3_FRAOC|nr:uncharacterized protein LOC127749661 [Frankliniella occidentalis]
MAAPQPGKIMAKRAEFALTEPWRGGDNGACSSSAAGPSSTPRRPSSQHHQEPPPRTVAPLARMPPSYTYAPKRLQTRRTNSWPVGLGAPNSPEGTPVRLARQARLASLAREARKAHEARRKARGEGFCLSGFLGAARCWLRRAAVRVTLLCCGAEAAGYKPPMRRVSLRSGLGCCGTIGGSPPREVFV